MCGGCFLDNIIVCPACKRDDEGYKSGDSESPFIDKGNGCLLCVCGHLFNPVDGEDDDTGHP